MKRQKVLYGFGVLALLLLGGAVFKYKSDLWKTRIDQYRIQKSATNSIEELKAALGSPTVDHVINLKMAMNNIRSNLYDAYPDPYKQDNFVRELIWFGHKTDIYCWYSYQGSQWVYVASLKREANVEF